jgi:hypothetical protein
MAASSQLWGSPCVHSAQYSIFKSSGLIQSTYVKQHCFSFSLCRTINLDEFYDSKSKRKHQRNLKALGGKMVFFE